VIGRTLERAAQLQRAIVSACFIAARSVRSGLPGGRKARSKPVL